MPIEKAATISRRDAIKGATLSAGAAFLPGLAAGAAWASSRIVVGTWGGDYARLMRKHIEEPILKPKGFEVVQEQASDVRRRARMVAEKDLPRGSTDVQALSSAHMFEMNAAGVLDAIDFGRAPNFANLLPVMRYPYGVGHIYSGKVVVYNPKLIAEAPLSFKDAFDPKHGDKIGVIDNQYQYVMLAAALAVTGDMTQLDAGKELLMAARKAGARIYPTNEAFAQALKSEAIGVGIMWKARAVQWQNAGINVEAVAPAEGLMPYVSCFCIPKNASNKDGAYAYLDAMLESSAQKAFAIEMGYNPTVTNAAIAPNLAKRIGFTDEEIKRVKTIDYEFLAKNDRSMIEWWTKTFKA